MTELQLNIWHRRWVDTADPKVKKLIEFIVKGGKKENITAGATFEEAAEIFKVIESS